MMQSAKYSAQAPVSFEYEDIRPSKRIIQWIEMCDDELLELLIFYFVDGSSVSIGDYGKQDFGEVRYMKLVQGDPLNFLGAEYRGFEISPAKPVDDGEDAMLLEVKTSKGVLAFACFNAHGGRPSGFDFSVEEEESREGVTAIPYPAYVRTDGIGGYRIAVPDLEKFSVFGASLEEAIDNVQTALKACRLPYAPEPSGLTVLRERPEYSGGTWIFVEVEMRSKKSMRWENGGMHNCPNKPAHPADVLNRLCASTAGATVGNLAECMNVAEDVVTGLLAKEVPITTDLAMRLGVVFDIDPLFWVNMQRDYDMWVTHWASTDWLKARPLAGWKQGGFSRNTIRLSEKRKKQCAESDD